MKNRTIYHILLSTFLLTSFIVPTHLSACTSMIVGAKASLSGRPLLWKHRDTSAEHNFIERVEADVANQTFGYVALFNAGDSLLNEAWMGMNDVGFAIMNTASYNLAPDTTDYKDREGIVMSKALQKCRTVDDFEYLLKTMPKPLGVQANFGVIDADGDGAYFETDDYSYVKYDVAETEAGVLIRTNYSFSGNDTDGYGYIRYENTKEILKDEIADGRITPASLTEGVSRSFYHSLMCVDAATLGDRWVVDQDFVPRRTSTASIVIEGLLPGETSESMIMWTALGYPPCSRVVPVFLDSVPEGLRPSGAGWRSPVCTEVVERKHKVFSIKRGNGPCYIDMPLLKSISEEQYQMALDAYAEGSRLRASKKPR